MSLLSDPRLFNFILMALNLLAAARFAFAHRPWDACYWLSAFALTFCITMRYQR